MTINVRRRPRAERWLAALAVVGGALAIIAGSPTRSVGSAMDVAELARVVEQEEDHVTAVELAHWIQNDKPGLRILDIRSDSEFAELHIPGAKRVPLGEIARMPIDGAATYVLYSEGGTHAAQGWFLLKARGVKTAYFLRGGLYEWLEQVMNPRVASSTPQAQRDSIRALTLWFGGKMELVDSATTSLTPSILETELGAVRTAKTRESIKKIRRRAC